MPQIYSNFIFRSKQPNFERDSFDTYKEMTETDPDWIDEGHISYCKEKKTHYIFKNSGGDNPWVDIKSYITDLNTESIEDNIIQNIVFQVDYIKSLTNILAAELSLGRIVYVYENNKLYYNTYDKNGNKSTPSIHIEGGTGWFFPILNHEDLQSIDETVSGLLDLNLGSNIDDINIKIGAINNKINTLNSDVSNIKKDYVKNEDFLNLRSDINSQIGALNSNISIIKKDYVKKEDLPEFGESDVTKEDLDKISEQVLSAVTTAGSTQKSLDEFKKEVEDVYASKTDLNEYVKNPIFQDSQAATISRIQNIEKDIDENIKPKLNNIAYQGDLEALKNEIDDTYVKPDEVSSLLNNYSPSIDYENKWIGSDFAGDLAGKTGGEVAKEHYTYNEVLDEMLFGDYTPTRTEPSVNVDLFPEWNDEQSINWYDEDNRIILIEGGSKGPDGNDFIATNIIDSIISYPKGVNLSNKFTNGLTTSDEQPKSIGFCKIKNENGEWVYYNKEGNKYHVPAELIEGEYRYYMAAYFQKGSPMLNNNNMVVEEWKENNAVESKDYITFIASKPTYKLTKDGMTKNPLVLWEDEMNDYMELEPSCILNQTFSLPRKIKSLSIWNDIAGDYAMIPMVYGKDEEGKLTDNLIPAYFKESVEENGYYTYTYDSTNNGHRGAIKIKVTF